MSVQHKEVGPNRYRETFGRYFEDFAVGHVYEHRPGRTISEVDNTWFTLLTMNQHPLHFDTEYARHSEFGKPLVNSCLTLSLVAGMTVSDVSQKAIANLGWDLQAYSQGRFILGLGTQIHDGNDLVARLEWP